MALPTLNSYSAAKNLTTPQEMIRKQQETEREKKVERAQTASHLKTPTRPGSTHSKWISPISGVLSDEALRIEKEKEEKLNRLEQRRKHLSTMLEDEKNKHQNELTSFRQLSRESTSNMNIHIDSHRSIHEKSFNNQMTNNSDLYSIEQQKLENLQSDYWSEDQQDEEDSLYQYLNDHNTHEYENQSGREKRIEQLKTILQQQMDEIKQKEEESEILKQEEERLLKEQSQLDQYEEERKQMEKRYIQQDHGRQLLRQHKAKLHKRSKEIQEQLEFDMKILILIANAGKQSRLEQSEKQNQIKQNASNILKQFEQQLKFEKEKDQQLDALYQDEIDKQWSNREQEWNSEKELREKSIHQIIDDRQEQIMELLKLLKIEQQEIDEKQRILIHDMEQARKYNLIEKQKQTNEREKKKRISIIPQERTQSRIELEKQDTYQTQIDQSVQKQKPDITTKNVEQKFYGRRRINWN